MVSLNDPEALHHQLMRPRRLGRELVYASTRRTLSSASCSAKESRGYPFVSDAFLTAYDPPWTLVVADAMTPAITTVHAITSPVVPTPGPGLNIGASKTTDLNEPSSVSAKSQIVPPPEKTTNPGSDPGQDLRSHQPQFGSKQQGKGPETLDDPGEQSATLQGPEMASRSSKMEHAKPTNQVISGLDMECTSPDQMSRIESALAPRPQSTLI